MMVSVTNQEFSGQPCTVPPVRHHVHCAEAEADLSPGQFILLCTSIIISYVFLTKYMYFQVYEMFSGEQRRESVVMNLFSAVYYIPFMLQAKNTARCDLNKKL